MVCRNIKIKIQDIFICKYLDSTTTDGQRNEQQQQEENNQLETTRIAK
jgi:hypothetical protein